MESQRTTTARSKLHSLRVLQLETTSGIQHDGSHDSYTFGLSMFSLASTEIDLDAKLSALRSISVSHSLAASFYFISSLHLYTAHPQFRFHIPVLDYTERRSSLELRRLVKWRFQQHARRQVSLRSHDRFLTWLVPQVNLHDTWIYSRDQNQAIFLE